MLVYLTFKANMSLLYLDCWSIHSIILCKRFKRFYNIFSSALQRFFLSAKTQLDWLRLYCKLSNGVRSIFMVTLGIYDKTHINMK